MLIGRNDTFQTTTVNLLISSPQVKTFMILTHLNINPELLIKLVASKLRMWAETHP